jgi:hypothetical protein
MGTTSYLSYGIRVYWSLFKGVSPLGPQGPLKPVTPMLTPDRYASDLTPDQKDALLDVIRARPHPTISTEIRREIVNSVERGAPRPDDAGDDVVMR